MLNEDVTSTLTTFRTSINLALRGQRREVHQQLRPTHAGPDGNGTPPPAPEGRSRREKGRGPTVQSEELRRAGPHVAPGFPRSLYLVGDEGELKLPTTDAGVSD